MELEAKATCNGRKELFETRGALTHLQCFCRRIVLFISGREIILDTISREVHFLEFRIMAIHQ
jgi:hypothetical protein